MLKIRLFLILDFDLLRYAVCTSLTKNVPTYVNMMYSKHQVYIEICQLLTKKDDINGWSKI